MKFRSKAYFALTIILFCISAGGCSTSEKTSSTTPTLKTNASSEDSTDRTAAATGSTMALKPSVSSGSIAATGNTLTVSPGVLSKNKEPVSLETNRMYEINLHDQFSISRISTGNTVWASLGSDYYYENPKKGQVYIDLVIDYTNSSPRSVPVSDIFSLSAKDKKGKKYTCKWFTMEIEQGTRLSSHESVPAGQTAKLHCAISVPDKKADYLLSLKCGERTFEMNYKFGQEITSAVSIDPSAIDVSMELETTAAVLSKEILPAAVSPAAVEPSASSQGKAGNSTGSSIAGNSPSSKEDSSSKESSSKKDNASSKKEDNSSKENSSSKNNCSLLVSKDSFGSFRLVDLFYTRDLRPGKNTPGTYYHILEEDKDKTFLVAKLKVTNESGEAKAASSIINASVCYKKNFRHSYRGFSLSENPDKKGFEGVDLAPGEKRTVYVVMEVPLQLKKQPKTVTFYFAGKEYLYQ